jgi:hypothetical protein
LLCSFQRVGAGSLLGRFVPFVAIAAANCINIPLMRQRELKYGIPIYDDQDNRLGTSKVKKLLATEVFLLLTMAITNT